MLLTLFSWFYIQDSQVLLYMVFNRELKFACNTNLVAILVCNNIYRFTSLLGNTNEGSYSRRYYCNNKGKKSWCQTVGHST